MCIRDSSRSGWEPSSVSPGIGPLAAMRTRRSTRSSPSVMVLGPGGTLTSTGRSSGRPARVSRSSPTRSAVTVCSYVPPVPRMSMSGERDCPFPGHGRRECAIDRGPAGPHHGGARPPVRGRRSAPLGLGVARVARRSNGRVTAVTCADSGRARPAGLETNICSSDDGGMTAVPFSRPCVRPRCPATRSAHRPGC